MIRRAAWLWLAVVLLACFYLGLRLHQGVAFRTDLLALLPQAQQDQAAQRIDDRVAAAVARRIVLLVGHPAAARARAAAAGIAARLQAAGMAEFSAGAPDRAALSRIGALYAPYRRGLLAGADRDLLLAGRADTLAQRALAKVFGFVGLVEAGQVRADPFLLLTDFFTALPVPASRLQPEDGMLSLRDGDTSWVMLAGTASGEPFALEFQGRIAAALAAAQAEQTAAHPGLHLLRLGAVFFARAGAVQALDESTLIGLASVAGTVVLLLAVFRSAQALVLTLLAIGVGIAVALSACLALFGAPHVAAVLFGVSLIGVVVDYSLQYGTEIFALPAAPPRARLRRVLVGISIGTVTTMIGYLTLLLAPFPGLRQIAVFSAVGLAASWLTVVLWLPALDRSRTPRHGAAMLALAGRVMAWWDGMTPRLLAVLLGGLGAVAGAGWLAMTADDDVRRMQSLSPPLVAEQQRIAALLGRGAEAQFFVVAAADDETALQREEALAARLAPLLGTALDGFQAPAQFVPSAARQLANRALVRAQLDGAALRRQTARLGIEAAPQPDDAAPVLTLAQALAAMPGFLGAMVLPPADGVVLHLVPLEGVHRADLLARAADGLAGVRLVDPASDFSALLGRYRLRAVGLLALSAALMLPLLAWRYGLRRGALVMLPPALAVLLAPALRALGGGGFSFFDAMAQVLVLSIGVDYAVFLAETTAARQAVTLLAVALAALAALLSFGLLALSGVAAVHGFGLTMTLGIGAAFLLAPLARSGGDAPAGAHWAALAERGAWAGLLFVAGCYRLFGRRACGAVLRPIVLYFYLAGGRRRRWTQDYLSRVARVTHTQPRPWRDGYLMYLNFAARALDNFAALRDPARAGPIEVVGGALLEDHVRAGVGGVLIVSHHGNVDICRAALTARLGRAMTILLHTRQAVRYNALLCRVRPDYLAQTIQVSEIGPGTAIDLLARVERGEWIAIAGDRPPLSGEARVSRVPFLGAPAPFSQGPYILAALLRCPVLLLFCVRAGAGHRATFEPFAPRIELPARRKQAVLEGWVRAYAARLQEHCLRDPLQWYNFFDFWAADEHAELGGGAERGDPGGLHGSAGTTTGAARGAGAGPGDDPAAAV
jgi:predicted exporter/predicted LPLAT superfamily acyltransferase